MDWFRQKMSFQCHRCLTLLVGKYCSPFVNRFQLSYPIAGCSCMKLSHLLYYFLLSLFGKTRMLYLLLVLRLMLTFVLHCAGWFARDLSTLSCASDVLLPLPAENTTKQPTQFMIPKDCFEILGSLKDQTYQILNASVAKRFGSK